MRKGGKDRERKKERKRERQIRECVREREERGERRERDLKEIRGVTLSLYKIPKTCHPKPNTYIMGKEGQHRVTIFIICRCFIIDENF